MKCIRIYDGYEFWRKLHFLKKNDNYCKHDSIKQFAKHFFDSIPHLKAAIRRLQYDDKWTPSPYPNVYFCDSEPKIPVIHKTCTKYIQM